MENSSYFAIFLRIIDGEWFGKNTEIPTFSIYFQEKSTVRVPKSWQEPHVQHEFLLQKLGPKNVLCCVIEGGRRFLNNLWKVIFILWFEYTTNTAIFKCQ